MADLHILRDIVKTERPTSMTPKGFFIAWAGVPTLIYTGFTAPLANIQDRLDAITQSSNGPSVLNPRNSGAKWPKTSLGALCDGKTLTMDQLGTLKSICDKYLDIVASNPWSLEVNSLSVVLFTCKSLERRLMTQPIELDAHLPPDSSVTAGQMQYVQQTLSQFNCTQDYLDRINSGQRISDQRAVHIEATLVCDLGENQPGYIKDFQRDIDAALPGCYEWFEAESLHLTVRGLA